MKHYETSLFCDIRKGPTVHTEVSSHKSYPITLSINENVLNAYDTPRITIYLSSIRDLIKFKNSVISSFDKAMRDRYVWEEERSDV